MKIRQQPSIAPTCLKVGAEEHLDVRLAPWSAGEEFGRHPRLLALVARHRWTCGSAAAATSGGAATAAGRHVASAAQVAGVRLLTSSKRRACVSLMSSRKAKSVRLLLFTFTAAAALSRPRIAADAGDGGCQDDGRRELSSGGTKVSSFMVWARRRPGAVHADEADHGAYGVVCSANDNESGEKVAIKKINKAFVHLTDTKRTLREIKILRHFNHERDPIKDILLPVSPDRFDDVYIVCDLMGNDLHQIISSPQPLTDDHCQYFPYQILRALKCCPQRARAPPRPQAVELCSPTATSRCDFGWRAWRTRRRTTTASSPSTSRRGGTARPRSCSLKEHTRRSTCGASAAFSASCSSGSCRCLKDYIHQLHLITDVIGTLAEEDIEYVESEKARRYIRSLPYKRRSCPRRSTRTPTRRRSSTSSRCSSSTRRSWSPSSGARPPVPRLAPRPADELLAHAAFSFEFENQPLDKRMMKELIAKEPPSTLTRRGPSPSSPPAAAAFSPPPEEPPRRSRCRRRSPATPPAAPSDAAKDSPTDSAVGGK